MGLNANPALAHLCIAQPRPMNLMKSPYLSSLLILAVIMGTACKKAKSSSSSFIQYAEWTPPIQATAVDSMVLHPSGCGLTPVPADSTVIVELDIDQDGLTDFILQCTSWYQFVSASDPCANYHQSITISGASEFNNIAIDGNYNAVHILNHGESVGATLNWSNTATLLLASANAPFSTDFSGNAYLGLQIVANNSHLHFAWLSLQKTGSQVSLLSWAIQKSESTSIQAGQRE